MKIDLSKYEQDIISDIQKIVRIPSVRDTDNKSVGAPFGPHIKEAFAMFKIMCEEIGMETYIDPDGYYAYSEIGPKNQDMIGIIGHLDVVPEGDVSQWTLAKPFSGDIIDGQIVGRGTLDDKGPIILNIYAIKALLDSGYKLNKRIRIIAGGAEETTWEGIDKYVKEQESPSISYSPDAEFPLIYAEKSIIRADVKYQGFSEFKLIAKGAYNAVNDHCIYEGPKVETLLSYITENGYKAQIIDSQLHVYGKSAHSMEAFIGVNAILIMAQALYNNNVNHPITDFLATQITTDIVNTKLFGKVEDEISGVLTTNIGLCEINEKSSFFGIDLRIPVLIDADEIEDVLKQAVKNNSLEYKQYKRSEKLYVDQDSKLVTSLMSAYKKVTNDYQTKPIAIGGGTYARAFKNCVAFGPVFIDREMKCDIHQPNESYEIKHILPAVEIYIEALINLQT